MLIRHPSNDPKLASFDQNEMETIALCVIQEIYISAMGDSYKRNNDKHRNCRLQILWVNIGSADGTAFHIWVNGLVRHHRPLKMKGKEEEEEKKLDKIPIEKSNLRNDSSSGRSRSSCWCRWCWCCRTTGGCRWCCPWSFCLFTVIAKVLQILLNRINGLVNIILLCVIRIH